MEVAPGAEVVISAEGLCKRHLHAGHVPLVRDGNVGGDH